MDTYNYTVFFPGGSLAPVIDIKLRTPGKNPHDVIPCKALLDTGADFTTVPIKLLNQVNAQLKGGTQPILGVTEVRMLPYYVGIVLDDKHFYLTVPVMGWLQGEYVLIGRD
ncbi:MAG: hypothetical protein VKJ46_02455, partial [Leptolyngbyaceae bacterium]|nr:hypothetical protein [Leptolyngbyaceae bacterium]